MAIDANRIQKPFRKLRKLLRKNPKQPTPDQIHDLRTNARRLETTIHALSLDAERKGQRLLKGMARIRRRAGKVRNMDVLTGIASFVRVDDEQDCKFSYLSILEPSAANMPGNCTPPLRNTALQLAII
jgi:CHAD domain-containing protein